jgi:glycosyltransferase involved in cell wall biosynthesis
MSMSIAPVLPRVMPLVVGTNEIAATENKLGRMHVTVLEPPVDMRDNDPRLFPDALVLRRELGLAPTSTTVVIVGRLVQELKLEGLLTAMDVVPRMGRDVQLLVVGDGPARSEVEHAAQRTNRELARQAVVLAGELADPRPAYAVADIALGMGGSALRAMSFAKPLVVQGELGFWRTLDDLSVEQFLWQGWYGLGRGRATGAAVLRAQLGPLLEDDARRRRLGDFGRRLVEERFSLAQAARRQVTQYEHVLRAAAPPRAEVMTDGARSAGQYVRHAAGRKWGRLKGGSGGDDFNRTHRRPRAAALSPRGDTPTSHLKESS